MDAIDRLVQNRADAARKQKRSRLLVVGCLVAFIGLLMVADARWRLRPWTTHWVVLPHPRRIEVVNRSGQAVLVRLRDPAGRQQEALLGHRERDAFDYSSDDAGSSAAVVLIPLQLDSPAAVRRTVEWTPTASVSTDIVLDPRGEELRSERPETHGRSEASFRLASNYPLPVHVNADVRETLRSNEHRREGWVGRREPSALSLAEPWTFETWSTVPAAGNRITYTLPDPAAQATTIQLPAGETAELLILLRTDGEIVLRHPTWWDRHLPQWSF